MDYYSKYLKYKKKYIDLKNIYGGAGGTGSRLPSATIVTSDEFFNSEGYEGEIQTIFNNGMNSGLSQQCMYISILDYLRRTINYQGTLRELRDIAGVTGFDENNEWDEINPRHVESLKILAKRFDLDIRIWQSSIVEPVLDTHFITPLGFSPRARYGNGNPNVVNILAGDRHFQLITGGSIFGSSDRSGSEYTPILFDQSTNTHVPVSSLNKEKQLEKNLEQLKSTRTFLKNEKFDITEINKEIKELTAKMKPSSVASTKENDFNRAIKHSLIDSQNRGKRKVSSNKIRKDESNYQERLDKERRQLVERDAMVARQLYEKERNQVERDAMVARQLHEKERKQVEEERDIIVARQLHERVTTQQRKLQEDEAYARQLDDLQNSSEEIQIEDDEIYARQLDNSPDSPSTDEFLDRFGKDER